MNPKDGAARGIKDGDIVRAFNDRAQVLFAAYCNERIIPGTVAAPDGALYDPVDPGNPNSLDKGGAINTLAPARFQSKNVSGEVWSAYLVEVEKWVGPVPQSVSEKRGYH